MRSQENSETKPEDVGRKSCRSRRLKTFSWFLKSQNELC